MAKYARTLRTSFESTGDLGPGAEVAMPGLAAAGSQLAVPALALGQLVGAILVESEEPDRYSEGDVILMVRDNWVRARADQQVGDSGRTADSTIWHGELYPRMYTPPGQGFSIYKPNVRVSGVPSSVSPN